MSRRNNGRNNNRQRSKSLPPSLRGAPILMKNTLRSHSDPKMPFEFLDDWGLPVKRTNTVTTGVLAVNEAFSVSDLINFTSRYGALFAEYMVCKIQFHIKPIVVSTGLTIICQSPDTNNTPTLAQVAGNMNAQYIDNTNAPAYEKVITYYPCGTEEMVWTDTSGTLTYNNRWYMYTDNAVLGATTVATDLFVTWFTVVIAYRGYVS